MADFHRVKTSTPLEFPPPTTRPAAQPTTWDWLVLYVARPLWGFRVELASALLVLGIWRWLADQLGRVPALVVLVAVVGGLLTIPDLRRRMLAVAHRARVRRRWATACRYTGLAAASDRIPRIVRHALVPAGDRLLVRLPPGSSTAALAEAAEQVAVILDVREVRVARDPDRASLARVTVVRRDPLHGAPPLAWPWLDAGQCSLWQPIPVGVDEDGHWVTITLPERHVLLGGESGAGKSGGLALLLAAAALDPTVKLILLDGKLVELACWAGIADRSVGPDLTEAIKVMAEVQAELDRRLVTLMANRRRTLTPTLGLPLLLVVIDELALYVAGPTASWRPSSPPACGTWWPGAGPPGSSSARPPKSPPTRSSPPPCGTCSGSAGPSAASPPSLRHHPRLGLGQPRLCRLHHRRRRPGGRAATGRGRATGAAAGLLAGRRPARGPGRPRRSPPGRPTPQRARPSNGRRPTRPGGRVMPRPRQDRMPERTGGITVELTEFGLWIEVHNQPGGWEGVFLPARALRALVALAPEQRLAALAALDPAVLAVRQDRRRRQVPTQEGDGEPGAA